jgi:hypothetical protein
MPGRATARLGALGFDIPSRPAKELFSQQVIVRLIGMEIWIEVRYDAQERLRHEFEVCRH